jgi:DNA uptake protein ComE-like DNA-binding protein
MKRAVLLVALLLATTAAAQTVDVNRANQLDLTRAGLSPGQAAQVVLERQKHGPYTRIEDLESVPGLRPDVYNRVRPHLSVGPQPSGPNVQELLQKQQAR